ncbi:50S ribosomal protein L32e [uncultured archaeon]|nr:50S ribosomal protein L32e [uncultured archaeon]
MAEEKESHAHKGSAKTEGKKEASKAEAHKHAEPAEPAPAEEKKEEHVHKHEEKAAPKKPAEKKKAKKAVKAGEESVEEESSEGVAAEAEAEPKEKKPVKKEKKVKVPFKPPVEKIVEVHARKFEGKDAETFAEVNLAKKKKPRFIGPELWKKPQLKERWRTPRGIDSKQLEGKRGKPLMPSIGYKKPEEFRGLTPAGYVPILVKTTEDLAKLKPKQDGAIIAASVGRKKRNEIIKAANAKKIVVLNPRRGEV